MRDLLFFCCSLKGFWLDCLDVALFVWFCKGFALLVWGFVQDEQKQQKRQIKAARLVHSTAPS